MQKIGAITIDDTYYPGQDLYSDGAIEDEMLEIAKQYPESEYNRVITERKSWPILYHFSNIRENIITALPIGKHDRVLEIGAGCGAITGALSRMAAHVDAVDLSMKRSLINAYRHKDCDNVTIKVGNFQDVEQHLDEPYDVITLIGVFEYACCYIDGEEPYAEFLRIIKKHLTKNGKIIIAIENKFGLKYWAGCREDHTGNFFEGLEGYAEGGRVRTFAKKELESLLAAEGFSDATFYYPYPDYKLPEKLFTDAYLPQINELNVNRRNFDRNRVVLFDENKVFGELIKAGLFPEFSNSYLIVAEKTSQGQETEEECKVDTIEKLSYTKYSNQRSERFAIRTDIVATDEGRVVRKYPETKAAYTHIQGMQKSYEMLKMAFAGSRFLPNRAKLTEDYIELEYVEGQSMEAYLDACLMRDDMEAFSACVKTYADEVRKVYAGEAFVPSEPFYETFGQVSLSEDTLGACGMDIDLIFSNIILQEDSQTVIDYEWTFDFMIPVDFVLWRAGKVYLENYGNRARVTEDAMNELLGIRKGDAEIYRQMELFFLQQYCYQGVSDLYALYDSMGEKAVAVSLAEAAEHATGGIDRMQIYYDLGPGFSEENSDMRYVYPDVAGSCQVSIPLPKDIRALRIDPAQKACMVRVDKAVGYTDSGVYELKLRMNEDGMLDDMHAINNEDPQIHVTNLKTGTTRVDLQYCIRPLTAEQMASVKKKKGSGMERVVRGVKKVVKHSTRK